MKDKRKGTSMKKYYYSDNNLDLMSDDGKWWGRLDNTYSDLEKIIRLGKEPYEIQLISDESLSKIKKLRSIILNSPIELIEKCLSEQNKHKILQELAFEGLTKIEQYCDKNNIDYWDKKKSKNVER